MGMPGERAVSGTTPSINDIVIQGYLVLVVKGNVIGSDSSELKVADEGSQVNDRGLRQLWTGSKDAGGHKSAGGALGVATFIAFHNPAGLIVNAGKKVHAEMSGSNKPEAKATQAAKGVADALKERFQEQAWIK